MSYRKFSRICAHLRFDKKESRQGRKKDAPISFIWESVISKCTENYVPSEQITVDEQLCTTRGRVGFKTYIPTKPGKYGIKIWVLADAKNAYLCNAQIYTGKQSNLVERNQGERVVLELSQPFLNKGRTITCDNFFTSVSLAKRLLYKKTTLVGTVRKRRTFLPVDLQKNNKNIGAKFLFSDKITLCHFTDKPGKSVILLSSLHHGPNIDDNGKPDIVNYYNETKAGVDTLDQIVRFFTVRRKSLRWPMTIFYNLLDIVGYNSFIIHSMKYPECVQKNKWRARKNYLIELAKEILSEIKPMKENEPKTQNDDSLSEYKRRRCSICPREKDTKTTGKCGKCSKAMCPKHMSYICSDCF